MTCGELRAAELRQVRGASGEQGQGAGLGHGVGRRAHVAGNDRSALIVVGPVQRRDRVEKTRAIPEGRQAGGAQEVPLRLIQAKILHRETNPAAIAAGEGAVVVKLGAQPGRNLGLSPIVHGISLGRP